MMLKNLANDNPITFYQLNKMKVQDIFDYLVVAKQQRQIDDWKESKSLLPM